MRRALPLIALVLAACEAPFDPIAESDLAFALSGYLDASADTQWVRVERVDPVAGVERAAALDVTVTLAAEGGEPVVLAQEVRTFVTGPAHLFWTDTAIAPGTAYRLRAVGSDGVTAETRVAVPDTAAFEVRVEPERNNCPIVVTATGVPRVADVQARYVVVDPLGREREVRFSHLLALRRTPDGFRALVHSGDDTSRLALDRGHQIVSAELVVAGAEADWPETVGLTIEQALVFGGAVEGGGGFVGGVVTRRFPFTPVISFGRSCMSGRL